MKFSALKNENMISPLSSMGTIRPKNSRAVRMITATLILTSLVDAFSILVIYLLFNSANTQRELQIHKEIHLPTAEHSQALNKGVGVQVVRGGYILNNKRLSSHRLMKELKKLALTMSDKNEKSLIVQADKDADFSKISPLLTIASEAGFENIRFATVGGGS